MDDDKIAGLVAGNKGGISDCAVTLSVGEHSYETYKKWFDAGADRYLLRHETANPEHYAKLHPPVMSLAQSDAVPAGPESHWLSDGLRDYGRLSLADFGGIWRRICCLCGIWSRRWWESARLFPTMRRPLRISAGNSGAYAFAPVHRPADAAPGAPPATTALGTIDPTGREQECWPGPMWSCPIWSPLNVRKKYMLYDNKISTGAEAASNIADCGSGWRLRV